jgi:hypothetical protein
MNERDWEWVWGRTHGHAQIDVAGMGWGWIGGGGAWEGWLARLGTMRGAERDVLGGLIGRAERRGGGRGGLPRSLARAG